MARSEWDIKNKRRIVLIKKKNRKGLIEEELKEYESLQGLLAERNSYLVKPIDLNKGKSNEQIYCCGS